MNKILGTRTEIEEGALAGEQGIDEKDEDGEMARYRMQVNTSSMFLNVMIGSSRSIRFKISCNKSPEQRFRSRDSLTLHRFDIHPGAL